MHVLIVETAVSITVNPTTNEDWNVSIALLLKGETATFYNCAFRFVSIEHFTKQKIKNKIINETSALVVSNSQYIWRVQDIHNGWKINLTVTIVTIYIYL